jgi:hypothetical protein
MGEEMSYPIMTVDDALLRMRNDADELTDANYHNEAAALWDQAAALSNAVSSGVLLGYYSWGGNDIVGLEEVVLVRE